MDPLTDEQCRAIVSAFLDRLEDGNGLTPTATPFPYDPVPGLKKAAWPLFMAEELIRGELQELTNQLNHWLSNLRRWHAWNETLKSLDPETRWGAEWGWVEPLAFYCMFQPSASHDRFVMVATHALHQVRIIVDPTATDTLLGDPTTPEQQPSFPSRRQNRHQLKELAKPWSMGQKFIDTLDLLDSHGYRKLTYNFRNRASHGIAPRFSVGFTSIVTRTRQQAMKLEQQPNGTYKDVPVPGKLSTCYSFGGTPPLSMQDAWSANLDQFEHARRTFDAYVALLTEAVAVIPCRPDTHP